MSEIILHIGMHKTGSTSIQLSLHQNRKKLEALGFAYGDLGSNHSRPIFSLLSEAPETYRQNVEAGVDTVAKAAAYNRRMAARLDRQLHDLGQSRLILSGENFSIFSRDAVRQLKDFLGPFASRFRVVGYIRPPNSFLASAIEQRLRSGQTIEEIRLRPPRPRYRWRFKKFLEIFGDENVEIVLFAPRTFPQECVVQDFLKRIGVAEEALPKISIKRQNTSTSVANTRLLGTLVRVMPGRTKSLIQANMPLLFPNSKEKNPGALEYLGARLYGEIMAETEKEFPWVESKLGIKLAAN